MFTTSLPKDKRTGKDIFDLTTVVTGHGAGQSRLRFKSGDVIYAQGDAPDASFYVEQGHIEIAAVARSMRIIAASLMRKPDARRPADPLGRPAPGTSAAAACRNKQWRPRRPQSDIEPCQPDHARQFTHKLSTDYPQVIPRRAAWYLSWIDLIRVRGLVSAEL